MEPVEWTREAVSKGGVWGEGYRRRSQTSCPHTRQVRQVPPHLKPPQSPLCWEPGNVQSVWEAGVAFGVGGEGERSAQSSVGQLGRSGKTARPRGSLEDHPTTEPLARKTVYQM